MAELRRPERDESERIQDETAGCRLPWWAFDPEWNRAEEERQDAERRELNRPVDELEAGL